MALELERLLNAMRGAAAEAATAAAATDGEVPVYGSEDSMRCHAGVTTDCEESHSPAPDTCRAASSGQRGAWRWIARVLRGKGKGTSKAHKDDAFHPVVVPVAPTLA